MTTLLINSWAKVDKDGNPTTVAVTDDQEEAERIALRVSVNTARTALIEDSPLDVANARLRAHLCPECGSGNVHFGYAGSTIDPGDADPTADCRDCGWGY